MLLIWLLPRYSAANVLVIVLPVFYIGFVIVAQASEYIMTVQVPLCSLHRRHWSNRHLFNFVPIFLMLCTCFSVKIEISDALPGELQEKLFPMIHTGYGLALIAWLSAAVVWHFRLIRTGGIDICSITLKAVAPAFVAAVKRMEHDRTG
jgi:hypothetical protein